MHQMVRERLRAQMQDAGAQALRMANIELSDIQHFEGFDASTIHLINQVEGYGFTEPGTGFEFCKAGHMAVGGSSRSIPAVAICPALTCMAGAKSPRSRVSCAMKPVRGRSGACRCRCRHWCRPIRRIRSSSSEERSHGGKAA